MDRLNEFWYRENDSSTMEQLTVELQALRTENKILREALIYITEQLKIGTEN